MYSNPSLRNNIHPYVLQPSLRNKTHPYVLNPSLRHFPSMPLNRGTVGLIDDAHFPSFQENSASSFYNSLLQAASEVTSLALHLQASLFLKLLNTSDLPRHKALVGALLTFLVIFPRLWHAQASTSTGFMLKDNHHTHLSRC